jgi:hypothetical protein
MNEFENYKKEKLTIDLVWANIFGILILIPVVLIFGLPYYLIWDPKLNITSLLDSMGPQKIALGGIIVIGIFILGIVGHELIHGITWALFAKKGFKSIKFGVLWTMLNPYCHCDEPLKVKQYIIGGFAPALILGITPSILAILIGNLVLLMFGIFFTMVAAGDFLIINLLRKEDSENYVLDHPSEVGCYIFRRPER